MANVIVLSSESEEEGGIPLPFQEIERQRSYSLDDDFDYGTRASCDNILPQFKELPSTAFGSNSHRSISKKPRVVHDMSDSDDDDKEPLINNFQQVSQSSDDELPDINININLTSSSRTLQKPQCLENNFEVQKTLHPSKSLEPVLGRGQKRQEQRLCKQLELAEKAKQRQAKQEARELKKKEAAYAKALKQANTEMERSKKKGECLKWITVTLDPGLLNADYSGELLTALRSSEIDYKVEDCIIPYSANWDRRIQNVEVDDNMGIQKTTTTQNEPFVLVVWTWNKLVTEIHEDTIQSTIEEIISLLPEKEFTIVIFGLEDYFRFQKTRKRRDVRSEILGTGSAKRKAKEGSVGAAPVVGRGNVESILTELQVKFNVNHRIINTKIDLANLVCQFSKAIAEAPLKRESNEKFAERFDWYALGDSKDCVAVDKDGNGTLQLWLRQLCQFPLASRETSEAIASVYPSPLSLLMAYEKCSTEEDAQHLLENIPVRRGPGPISTSRRIGPQLSKKIHTFFTAFDESSLIAPD